MKKLIPLLSLAVLAACSEHEPVVDKAADLENQYTVGWIKRFGLIDPNHTWNMAQPVKCDVAVSRLGAHPAVCIYTADPADGGRLIGRATRDMSMTLDVVTGTEAVYAVITLPGGKTVSQGWYTISGGKVTIDGNARKGAPSRVLVEVPADTDLFDWTVACEDLGDTDDFDFNDIVLGIRHISGEDSHVEITALAAGGIKAAEIYLGDELVGEIHDLVYENASTRMVLNTISWSGIGRTVNIPVGPEWSIATAMGGLRIHVLGTDAIVKASRDGGAPQMICVKGDWQWPSERTDIIEAYPDFDSWNGDRNDISWCESGIVAGTITWKTSTPSQPDEPETPAAPTPDYSLQMIDSQCQAWSGSWTHATKVWDYVPGLVSKAVLTYCEQYPEDTYTQTAFLGWGRTYADRAFDGEGNFNTAIINMGNNKVISLDNIASGKVLLSMYRLSDNAADKAKYKAGADYLASLLANDYPRIASGDGAGGWWHKYEYDNQMWLDGLYMGTAYYAEYLSMFDPSNTAAWDDVTLQFTTIHQYTYDSVKQLNYHAWSATPTDDDSFWARQSAPYMGTSPEFWGRGIGWYVAALADVLEYMPASNSNYATLANIYRQVAAGLKAWQDPASGAWYQLVQYDSSLSATLNGETRSNYLEASASSMFTYGLLKGLRLGVIDEATYGACAENAWHGLLNTFVSGSGTLSLNNICKSAGLGPASKSYRDGSIEYYLLGSDAKEVVSNEGKGLGAFVFASLEWEKRVAGN